MVLADNILKRKGVINITLKNDIIELYDTIDIVDILDLLDIVDPHGIIDIHPKGFKGINKMGLKFDPFLFGFKNAKYFYWNFGGKIF